MNLQVIVVASVKFYMPYCIKGVQIHIWECNVFFQWLLSDYRIFDSTALDLIYLFIFLMILGIREKDELPAQEVFCQYCITVSKLALITVLNISFFRRFFIVVNWETVQGH